METIIGTGQPVILGKLTASLEGMFKDSMNPAMKDLTILTGLCAKSTIPNREPTLTTNWIENAKLEEAGILQTQADIGNIHLAMAISPIQAVTEWSGVTDSQKDLMHRMMEKNNLPPVLQKLIQVHDVDGTIRMEMDLLDVGVAKQRLAEGFVREIAHTGQLGTVPENFVYQEQKGDPGELQVQTSRGVLQSNVAFISRRVGEGEPAWTVKERGIIQRCQEDGTSVMTIFEPTGTGKTFLAKRLITDVAKSHSKDYLGSDSGWVSQKIYDKMPQAYYIGQNRVDNIVVVSPTEGGRGDINKVIDDFDQLLARRPGPCVLVIDNAQKLQFPTEGEWFNRIENTRNLLSGRRDGSGIFILGESMPENFNVSQAQEHRIGLEYLSFGKEDIGISDKKGSDVNRNAPGYTLIANKVGFDEQGLTFYRIRDRFGGKDGTSLAQGFDDKYKASHEAIVQQMTVAFISSPQIRTLIEKDSDAARFLTRSHLSAAGTNLHAQLIRALEDTTGSEFVSVTKAGTFKVDTEKLNTRIREEANLLVQRVKEVAKGKKVEFAAEQGSVTSLEEQSTAMPKEAVQAAPGDVISALKQEEGQVQNDIAALEHQLSEKRARAGSIAEALLPLKEYDPEQIQQAEASVGIAGLAETIVKGGDITAEVWNGVNITGAGERLAELAKMEGLDGQTIASLQQLGSLMGMAGTFENFGTIKPTIEILVRQIGNKELFPKTHAIVDGLQKAREVLKST